MEGEGEPKHEGHRHLDRWMWDRVTRAEGPALCRSLSPCLPAMGPPADTLAFPQLLTLPSISFSCLILPSAPSPSSLSALSWTPRGGQRDEWGERDVSVPVGRGEVGGSGCPSHFGFYSE